MLTPITFAEGVESTMRSAYERGFNVITLTDCTASTGEEETARRHDP